MTPVRPRLAAVLLVLITTLPFAACIDEPPPRSDSARFASATGALEPEQNRWIVSPTAIGSIRLGMTSDSIGALLGDSTFAPSVGREACTYGRSRRLPRGTSLMMSGGRLVRIDVDSAGTLTDTGLQVGDSEIAVMVMFSGRVSVDTDKYRGPPSHVLTVAVPGDSTHIMLFNTDGSNVTSYRTGRRSAVELTERCG